ncbi:sterol desaturase family protein [Sphingomonas crocodyli]|uniref:Sterol desaturase family protein n=1 Tax=Sphingomonas crocodyli TaxID=1979270 RepID=A0A437MA88_9SPHN|nr:sterol desaturase family protein [Sphingomonas crocodyli]RVT94560.1 sterol desaturase family protein [Sphingomonas crocodyli]
MTIFHYIALGMFATFVIVDLIFRARDFPRIGLWPVMGAASAVLYFAIGTYAPFLWDAWLGERQLFDGRALPFVVQVVGGLLLLELGVYVWHRTMHRFDPLWRAFHQMHHSAERVDIWGAFYFHPLDMLGWALLSSLCLVGIVGLSPEATLIVALAATFLAMFQHANIRTPHWLGYIVQRPESHALHHQRGVHGHNYSDLPIWDIVLGTFRNPRAWADDAGLHAGSTMRVLPLLVGRKLA